MQEINERAYKLIYKEMKVNSPQIGIASVPFGVTELGIKK